MPRKSPVGANAGAAWSPTLAPPSVRAVVSGTGAAPRGGLPQPGVIRPVSLAPAANANGVPPGTYANPTGSVAVVASGAMTSGSAHIITPRDGSGSGGGGGGGSGNPGNPTVTVNGDNVVGGPTTATVVAPGGATFDSVSWKITGAAKSQSYTNASGTTADLPNPSAGNSGGVSSSISFFWNATTGPETVVATVTYAAPFTGGGTSNTATVTVIAPAVTPNKFVIDSQPLVWLPNINGTGKPGFTLQSTPPPPTPPDPPVPIVNGFSLGSEVTLPGTANQSGHYGFIQMVNATLTVTNKSTGPHVLTTNGFVLDNNPQFFLPNDSGWLSFGSWTSPQLNPGDTFSLPAWTKQVNGPNSPVDTPGLAAPSATVAGLPDPPIEMNINVQFYDWLIYQSGSGLWVGIGKTNILTITGDEKLDPATNTWAPVGALIPGDKGVIVFGGPAGPTFVTWTGYLTATDFNPPYPNPYWLG